MTENSTESGSTPRRRRSESVSTPAPQPSEPSTTNSHLPHRQEMQEKPQQTHRSEAVEKVSALLRGEEQKSPTVGDKEPSSALSTGDDASAEALTTAREPQALQLDGDDSEGGSHTPDLDDPVGAGEPFTPAELAEALGLSPKQLYEQLQITTGDGEELTFGEFKDRVQKQETAERESVQREHALDIRESEMLETLQLLDSVGASVIQRFPQAAKMLQEFGTKRKARERQAALRAMPELANQADRQQFMDDISSHMTGYGFRHSELNITDHRLLLALKDAISTKKKLQRLLDFDPEADRNAPKTARPQGKQKRVSKRQQRVAAANRTGQRSDQVAAVSALIKGQ